MLFNSYLFLFLFLPVTAVGFYLLARLGRKEIALTWLVAASFFFYGWPDLQVYLGLAPVESIKEHVPLLGLLLFSVVFNYSIGLLLGSKKLNVSRMILLGVGIAVNLALLCYFKYTNFFVDWISATFGSQSTITTIYLPLGISFYTFQQIAYVVDSYKGKTREYNFLHYCLFVTFFPQLIAGPIVHHKEMIPQFMRMKINPVKPQNIAVGLAIFILGLSKKVLIADNVAVYSTSLFTSVAGGETPIFAEAWIGSLAYTFQIYFDFSGYSDMAIGLARIFGIKLPLNFASPYKAVSIVDFWRRWHMTLSRFLRDYLYIPLGGNRGGMLGRFFAWLGRLFYGIGLRMERSSLRTVEAAGWFFATIAWSFLRWARGWTRFADRYMNLMLTMLLGGLWHGANWTYMIWGGIHGLMLILTHAWRAIRRAMGFGYSPDKRSWWGVVLSRTLTFLVIMLAWVFFKAGEFRDEAKYKVRDFAVARVIVGTMAGEHGYDLSRGDDRASEMKSILDVDEALGWIISLLIFVNLLPNTQQYMYRFRPAYKDPRAPYVCGFDPPAPKWLAWRPIFIAALALAALIVLNVMSLSKPTEFIYWQF